MESGNRSSSSRHAEAWKHQAAEVVRRPGPQPPSSSSPGAFLRLRGTVRARERHGTWAEIAQAASPLSAIPSSQRGAKSRAAECSFRVFEPGCESCVVFAAPGDEPTPLLVEYVTTSVKARTSYRIQSKLSRHLKQVLGLLFFFSLNAAEGGSRRVTIV